MYGVRTVVGIARFGSDTDAELALVQELVEKAGATAVMATHVADGGAGAEALAHAVVAASRRPLR